MARTHAVLQGTQGTSSTHSPLNGTLLLDEVGDMPLNQQAKLLRAIEENAVVPVRATNPVAVNVRVVAATNVDLHEAVEQGRFRRDFLDRLEVLTLRLPPLRERAEDFPLLVEHFLAVANEEEGTEVRPPAKADIRLMASQCSGMSIRVLRKAVTDVVLRKHGGCVNDGMRELGISKWLWYRAQKRQA